MFHSQILPTTEQKEMEPFCVCDKLCHNIERQWLIFREARQWIRRHTLLKCSVTWYFINPPIFLGFKPAEKRDGLGDSQEDRHGVAGAGEGLCRPPAMPGLVAITGKTELHGELGLEIPQLMEGSLPSKATALVNPGEGPRNKQQLPLGGISPPHKVLIPRKNMGCLVTCGRVKSRDQLLVLPGCPQLQAGSCAHCSWSWGGGWREMAWHAAEEKGT